MQVCRRCGTLLHIETPPGHHVAAVALGSNLGDRAGHLREAVLRLSDPPAVRCVKVSGLLETPPVGCPPGSPHFLNAAAVVETSLSARGLLERLLEIEADMGRRRVGEPPNAPRTIDLDLLVYGEEMIDEAGLAVPHPRMGEREFVLRPLAEVAPEMRVPGTGHTVAGLLSRLLERRS